MVLLMSQFEPPAPGVRAIDEAKGSPCPYCGRLMGGTEKLRPTRDHMLPRARGGRSDGAGNILIVCCACNNDKSDRTLGEFLLDLARINDPRSYRVAILISSIYSAMGAAETNRVVGGTWRDAVKDAVGAPKKCYLPNCDCVGFCSGIARDDGSGAAVDRAQPVGQRPDCPVSADGLQPAADR